MMRRALRVAAGLVAAALLLAGAAVLVPSTGPAPARPAVSTTLSLPEVTAEPEHT